MSERLSPEILGELTHFQRWKSEGKSLDLFDYAAHHLTLDLAIAVTKLVFPDFIEIDGYVTLATGESEKSIRRTITSWETKLGSDKSAIEKVINHRHLCDLVPCLDQASHAALVYFGDFLVRCWRHELLDRFPGRRIVMEGAWSEEDCDFILTYFQEPAS